ncbi:hypothetical protein QFC19_003370 [Naganishia cerealis]|uniref:Uncharacterized protein n=1 Tax=Naganishia cerealis TaxID=610337 RepID=A0ACC2W277_9TREE|nr:hypothetical protein QFC19_003370 [Naganishia cerealis]
MLVYCPNSEILFVRECGMYPSKLVLGSSGAGIVNVIRRPLWGVLPKPLECIEVMEGERGMCGKSMVDRDDFLDMSVRPSSITLTGGAKPSVWIGAGRGRPDTLVRIFSLCPTAALRAVEELGGVDCRFCDVMDGLEFVVDIMYGA